MEEDLLAKDKNIVVMKLLHYFITEKNYNPIILQGVENEIWLENMDEDYKVIRIVSGYIHNDEQFDFDKFKTKRIVKKIQKKTFSWNMNVFSIFLNLGDNVSESLNEGKNLIGVKISDEEDIPKNEVITSTFPDLAENMEYKEEGIALFAKLTGDINRHSQEDAIKQDKVFQSKYPIVTYILIAIQFLCFFIPTIIGQYTKVLEMFSIYRPFILAGQYYRLITGTFLHATILHLFVNCFSLYVIGSQLESFLGKIKYIVIYLVSALFGALLSFVFLGQSASVGASGAIFGLLGSLLYFGYHYRVYLGNVLIRQIVPIIVLNLGIGFLDKRIDNAAHIGGLVGGIIITMALGIDNKSSKFEMINGWIITFISLCFLVFMGFFYVK